MMGSTRAIPVFVFGILLALVHTHESKFSFSSHDSTTLVEYTDKNGHQKGHCFYTNAAGLDVTIKYTVYKDGRTYIEEVDPKNVDPERALEECKRIASEQAKRTQEQIHKSQQEVSRQLMGMQEQLHRQQQEMEQEMQRHNEEFQDEMDSLMMRTFPNPFPPGFPFMKNFNHNF